jgi:hypothetical protein
MRTLSQQELTVVSGAGLFSFLFKKKTTVTVDVVAKPEGSTRVDVKSLLANVLVNVVWGAPKPVAPTPDPVDTTEV